jgi:segregation and condensation protein B
MSDDRFERLRILEAVLFASAHPRTPTELARHLPDGDNIEELLAELRTLYANRGIELRQIGKGWAFRTAEDLAGRLRIEQTVTRKLSRAAIETLAVVAYHQPVTRAEIEEIRGVGLSKGTLDTLLEADWIRPFGRRQTPGRPVTWGTTQAFLDHFGLPRIGDLPGVEELKAAGLIDARPALTALTARGELTEVGQGEDVESKGAAQRDAEDGLDPNFGEDLVPEERHGEDGASANRDDNE